MSWVLRLALMRWAHYALLLIIVSFCLFDHLVGFLGYLTDLLDDADGIIVLFNERHFKYNRYYL